MREGHAAQRHLSVSSLIDLWGEAVGAANNEDQTSLTRHHCSLNERSEGSARIALSTLVEEVNSIRRSNVAKELYALSSLLLLRGKLTPSPHIGNHP